MLINWRVKGLSFDFQVDEIEEKNLLERLRNHEPGIVNRAILANTKLALRIAGSYARVIPHYKDEFLSAALYGLVLACNNNKKLASVSDLGKYLVSEISYSCQKFLRKVPRTKQLKSDVVEINKSDYDLRDLIKSLADDELESTVIDLRLKGYTDEEIAKLSQTYSHMYINNMRRRFGLRYLVEERKNEST